jgi:tetratricopeptide (TPR) repeat protein
MDILESILTLIETNLLDIITMLWIVWFTGMVLGLVVTTVSNCRTRRTLARLGQRYEHARRARDGDTVQFDLDLERIKTTLTQREAELGEDAERMGLDLGVLGVLENFRGKIQQRLADLPGTHHDLEDRLRIIYVGLNDFQDLCGQDQVARARLFLKRGATGKAVALLKSVRSLSNQQIAEASGYQFVVDRNNRLTANAAFLLGQLAETDFNYFTATQYYQLAADMEPSNLTYLKAAAELSYAFEELPATGHMLEQVLKIQEKLLGPEHLDLAQTLNNLGVLRHTEGRHGEAEAFYLWALEICEANLHPQDQEAVNLMQNYAAFLQDVGRCHEADALRARAAPA